MTANQPGQSECFQARPFFTMQSLEEFSRSGPESGREGNDFESETDAPMREFNAPQTRAELPALVLEFHRRREGNKQ